MINFEYDGNYFVRARNGAMLEIIPSIGDRGPQTLKDPGIRHLAVEVEDFDAGLKELRAKNVNIIARTVREQRQPSGFFHGSGRQLPAPDQPRETASLGTGTVLRRVFKAFEYRDFRLLWIGACTSSVGTWMQTVAQNWLVLELTNSPFLLGLDSFLGQIPIFLFSLIGGVVADRADRRKLLVGSQMVQMSCAFLLARCLRSRL